MQFVSQLLLAKCLRRPIPKSSLWSIRTSVMTSFPKLKQKNWCQKQKKLWKLIQVQLDYARGNSPQTLPSKTLKKIISFNASALIPSQWPENYATWKCKECDFPACEICQKIPTIPKKKPYRCESCLFPPCDCGTPRPVSTKYRSTNKGMKVWKCSKCKAHD